MRVPTLPLLRKDLLESGLRPRTFIVRLAFGLGLFAVFGAVAVPDLLSLGPGLQSLGYGRVVFEPMVIYLFISVAVFMPALVAGSIQDEEDRGSLEVLRTTALGDGEILLEKYASGVMRMASCMLLSLPLFGVAYAYGGLDPSRVALAFVALVMWTLQIGSLCMLVSVRTDEAQVAITSCYLWIIVICVGNVMLAGLTCGLGAVLTPVGVYTVGVIWRPPWTGELAMHLVPFVLTLYWLYAARGCLAERGPRKRKNYVRHARRTEDSPARKRLSMPTPGLPDEDPIAWRGCGGPRGEPVVSLRLLVVWWVLVTIGTLALEAYLVMVLYWLVFPFVVALAGAQSFSMERQNQTLAPLLVTPISTASILLQKARPVHVRIVWLIALLVPVAVLYVGGNALAVWSWGLDPEPRPTWGAHYFLGMLIACPLLLATAGYVGLFVGLLAHHGSRALFATVAVIAAWLVLPGLLFRPEPAALRAISPWGVMAVLHGRPGDVDLYWRSLLGTVAVNGAVLAFCAGYYHLRGGKRLGRPG